MHIFTSIHIFIFILQIVTGIFLTINYKPDAASAFASVEFIMRDVEWGWLIRYLHSTGASLETSMKTNKPLMSLVHSECELLNQQSRLLHFVEMVNHNVTYLLFKWV